MLATHRQPRPLFIKRATIIRALSVLAALAFGYIIAVVVFQKIADQAFTDVHIYAALSHRYSILLAGDVEGVLAYVLREVHFHFLYEWLTDYLGDPYTALQVISFVSAVFVFLYCTDGTLKTLALTALILSHPRILDLLGGAQRMSLCLAVFMVAMMVRKWPIRYALFALAISFHTYALIMVGSLLVYEFVLRKPTTWRKVIAVLLTGIIVFVTVVLREYILAEVGDRRSGISTETTGIAYMAMWALTGLAVHFFTPRLFFTPHGAMFYMLLLSAGTAIALGLYAERYIALAIVMLAASPFAPSRLALTGFVAVYGLNLALSYSYWL